MITELINIQNGTTLRSNIGELLKMTVQGKQASIATNLGIATATSGVWSTVRHWNNSITFIIRM